MNELKQTGVHKMKEEISDFELETPGFNWGNFWNGLRIGTIVGAVAAMFAFIYYRSTIF